MRRTIVWALLAPLVAIPVSAASAQSLLEAIAGLKFCRTIKDDGQRLKCFDGLMLDQPERPKEPSAGKEIVWKIEDSKSPIDDSAQVTATLLDNHDDLVGLGFRSAVLVLRCKEKKTEAFFSKPIEYFGSGPIKVLTRIGGGSPIETTWTTSTGRSAAFAPSPIQFIKALPDGGKLFIRATGYSGSPIDGEFALGKVSEVRDRIAAACKWPQDQKK